MQADGTVVTHLGDGDAVKTAPDGSVVVAAQFGRFEDGTQVCKGCARVVRGVCEGCARIVRGVGQCDVLVRR